MVTVPAFVWRGGFFSRALITGGGVGVSLAALAWIDSGLLLSAVIVLVIVGVAYGIWMPRRMARYWRSRIRVSAISFCHLSRSIAHHASVRTGRS